MNRSLVALVCVSIFLLFGCLSKPETTVEAIPDLNNHGPIMTSSVRPVYPEEAKAKGVEGTVWVKMWVDTLGRVKTAMINESPDPLLNEPAFEAAVQSKFKPAMRDGKRIGAWIIAPFEVRQ